MHSLFRHHDKAVKDEPKMASAPLWNQQNESIARMEDRLRQIEARIEKLSSTITEGEAEVAVWNLKREQLKDEFQLDLSQHVLQTEEMWTNVMKATMDSIGGRMEERLKAMEEKMEKAEHSVCTVLGESQAAGSPEKESNPREVPTSVIHGDGEAEDERIVLNIGGTSFTALRSTLTQHPTTLLGAMFSGRNASLLHSSKEYFFDRNPIAFGAVLDFYRTGVLVKPSPSYSSQLWKQETEFWGLPLAVSVKEEEAESKKDSLLECIQPLLQKQRDVAQRFLDQNEKEFNEFYLWLVKQLIPILKDFDYEPKDKWNGEILEIYPSKEPKRQANTRKVVSGFVAKYSEREQELVIAWLNQRLPSSNFTVLSVGDKGGPNCWRVYFNLLPRDCLVRDYFMKT